MNSMSGAIKRTIAMMMTAVMIIGLVPVTAEAASKKGTVKSVTIKNLDTTTLVLKKGKSFKLKTKVTVSGKASKKVTYSSSNKKVATVSKSGKIKAVKKGTAKITVKSVANSKKKATIKVTVGTPVTKVKLDKKNATAYVGDTVQLKATLSPKKPSIKKVKFSSDKKEVATVNSKGVVTCVGEGTAKITATATDGSGKKATCKITVEANPNATTEVPATTETPSTTETPTTTETPSEPSKPETPTTPEEDEVEMGDDLSYEGYSLDWADEFNGTELDRENWNVELHDPGWVNAELQEYVDSEDNIYIEDGKLVLNPVQTKNGDKYSYTSGRVNTQNKKTYTYGMFEVKAKVPEGMGYLPAFWLMANDESVYGQWPRCGEIDIMEIMGQNTKKAMGTIHFGNPHKESQGSYVLENGSFSSQYHTFTCEWEPGKITWYVDGNKFHEANDWYSTTEGGGTISYPAPFDQPFYIILNLAVGGSWVGYPDHETFVANPYMIDYVRVYQKDGGYDDSNVQAPVKGDVQLREPVTEDGNYLYNGDFEESEDLAADTNAWQFLTAASGVGSAEITTDDAIEGQSLVIETENPGTESHSIQLLQKNVPLKAGATYTLSFDAKASAARTIAVNSKNPGRNWYSYVDETINLTTTNQNYSYDFTMIHPDDAECTVEFNLGKINSTDTVVIDNVKLVKKSEDEDLRESIINPSKAVRADGNYIYNGQFQEGNKHLGDWEIPEGADVSVTSLADGRKLKVVVPENQKVVISQINVPVLANSELALSMDVEVPETGAIEVGFDGETYTVPASTDGSWNQKITTSAEVADKTFTLTFDGAGTYYVDNVYLAEDALIKNGSFALGSSGYEVWVDKQAGAIADFGVDSITEGNDNAAMLTVKHTGPYEHNIQLKQTNVNLEKDQWYRISVDARVLDIDGRQIKIALQRDGSKDNDWTGYFEKAIDLNNTYETFTYDFQMAKPSDAATILSISLGPTGIWGADVADPTKIITDSHRVCIDNIKLIKIDTPEPPEVVVGENMLQNADFSAEDLWPWEAAFDSTWGGDGTGTGTATVVDLEDGKKGVQFDITAMSASETAWGIHLKQGNIALENGVTYKLAFKVISTEAGSFKPSLQNSSGSVTYGGGENISLEAATMKPIEFTFTMSAESDNNAFLQINMGNFNDTVANITLSDFSLVKIGEKEEIEPIEVGVNQLSLESFRNTSENQTNAFEIQDDVMVFTIDSIGEADNTAQITHNGIQLDAGCFYELSFDVKASEIKNLSVNLMDGLYDEWYAGEASRTVNSTDDFVNVTYTFNMNDGNGVRPTVENGIFFISMGKVGEETFEQPVMVTFKNFKLVKVENNN